MVFSSLLFVFAFLALNLIAYFLVGSTHKRNIVLLVFSLVFYSWGGPKYLILLLGMTAVSWYTAKKLKKRKKRKNKKSGSYWNVESCWDFWVFLNIQGSFLKMLSF